MVPVQTLGGLCFLQDIAEEYLKQIASIAEEVEFPVGNVVFQEGDVSSHIHLVIEGRVALEIRVPGQRAVRIQTIGSGELLGWTPILGPGRMTATARTLTPCRLVSLRASQVLALCTHNPQFGLEFMRRTAQALSKRLNATRLQLLDVYRHELPVIPEFGGEA